MRLADRLLTLTREGLDGLLDLVFPPHCGACDRHLAHSQTLTVPGLCPACCDALRLLDDDVCPRCGAPLGPLADDRLPACHDCRNRSFAVRRTWAAARYEGPVRVLITRLKYARQPSLRLPLQALLARRLDLAFGRDTEPLALGSDVLAPADPAEETLRVSMRNPAPEPPPLPDVVVPVPLSDRRQRERGFNQTHLLAAHLALHLNLPLDDTNLVRTKHTEEQAGKTRAERLQSLRGAFAVCAPQRLDGRTVLLVDDVMTTGSTANACARVLRGMDDDRDGGAREVWLAVAARAITEKS